MSILNNTRIRTRILIIVIIPLLAISGFSFERYQLAQREKNQLSELAKVINYMTVSSSLVDALQNEREIAMVLPPTGGNINITNISDEEKLELYRDLIAQTDKYIASHNRYVEEHASELKKIPTLYSHITKAQKAFVELNRTRDYRLRGKIKDEEDKFVMIIYGVVMQEPLLASREIVLHASEDPELSLLANAFYNLLEGKNHWSSNSGLMLRILGMKKERPNSSLRIVKYFTFAQTAEDNFNRYATFAPAILSDSFRKDFLKSTLFHDLKFKPRAIRKDFSARPFTRTDWKKQSKQIFNMLQQFEKKTRNFMQQRTNDRLSDAKQRVHETLIFLIILLTAIIAIAVAITRSILNPLNTLVDSFKTIAETQNLDNMAPVKGNDEFADASKAFNELIINLRDKNSQIHAMLTNMQQGLFTIGPDGLVSEEYSSHLEDIFENKQLASMLATALLFNQSNITGDTLNQIQEALNAMIGENAFNFELNQHLLVGEYKKVIESEEKILALEWNPIVEEDEIEKIMVTVRDVTEFKAMEAEMAETTKELNILQQLLNIPAKKYQQFMQTTQQFLNENRKIINQKNVNQDELEKLFRNMHTIKGNARTYAFSEITDVVHQAETAYSNIRNCKDYINIDYAALLNDLTQVETSLERYIHVYENVLGRKSDSRRDGLGFWLNAEDINVLQKQVNSIQSELKLAGSKSDATQKINYVINRGLSIGLCETLSDLVAALPNTAEDLGKPAPEVVINDNNIRIVRETEPMLTDVFSHLLRNSIDHGIESAEERLTAGKAAAGKINIDLQEINNAYTLTVKDDGKGLNIGRLFEKGIELGLWQQEDSLAYAEIANIIFHSGTSTKETVSDISGRGVGMDAVKSFLEEQSCSIAIVIDKDKLFTDKERPCFTTFEFQILLPEELIVAMQQAA